MARPLSDREHLLATLKTLTEWYRKNREATGNPVPSEIQLSKLQWPVWTRAVKDVERRLLEEPYIDPRRGTFNGFLIVRA